MTDSLVINEVGPRDGLQNQPVLVSAADKIALVRALQAAGLTQLEIGSFVSPRAVPRLMSVKDRCAWPSTRPGIRNMPRASMRIASGGAGDAMPVGQTITSPPPPVRL